MSSEKPQVPCRLCPTSLVRAMCMDCHAEFAGPLALTIVIRGSTLGLCVNVEHDGHLHCIARLPLDIIPVVGI